MNGLPSTGFFTVQQWAEAFGISSDQFLVWIKKYQIPYYHPGKTFIIRAEDLWACVPRVTHGE